MIFRKLYHKHKCREYGFKYGIKFDWYYDVDRQKIIKICENTFGPQQHLEYQHRRWATYTGNYYWVIFKNEKDFNWIKLLT